MYRNKYLVPIEAESRSSRTDLAELLIAKNPIKCTIVFNGSRRKGEIHSRLTLQRYVCPLKNV